MHKDEHFRAQVQRRVLLLLTAWLGPLWWDFHVELPDLGARLEAFLQTLRVVSGLEEHRNLLLTRLRVLQGTPIHDLQRELLPSPTVAAPKPTLPRSKSSTLLDVEPIEIARQITLVRGFPIRAPVANTGPLFFVDFSQSLP